MSRTTRIVLASAFLVLGIGAGASLAGPPPAGGEKVELTLANPEPRERPASLIAEAFAARAKALSKGNIVVKVVYDAGRTTRDLPVGEQEANLIGMVRMGKADLAIVATRAFQPQGVTSFQALQAPFLITSDAAMAKVTTGELATKLQSGLGELGLVRLGLAPEGLRRPFGFTKALVSPADFKGTTIRAIPSKQTWALLRALGATPVDINGEAFNVAVANGSVRAMESSLAIMASGGVPALGSTAGNIAFFPKIDALVGNGKALRALSAEQRSILRQAAEAARSWALSNITEKQSRDAYCKQGGTVVTASPSAIKQLRAKSTPVLAELRRDPLTRALIARFEGLGAGGSGVAACSRGSDKGNDTGAKATSLIPRGVYRSARVTKEQLIAAGASPVDAERLAGVVTLTVTSDGYQRLQFDNPKPQLSSDCSKRKMYLRNGLVMFELRGPTCGGDFGVAWKLVPDGIRFTRVVPNDPLLRVVWLGGVWKRIA